MENRGLGRNDFGGNVATEAEIEAMVATLDGSGLVEAVERAKHGEAPGEARTVAAMIWAAFSCPDGVVPVYDAVAAAWGGGGVVPPSVDHPPAPLTTAFWDEFWSAVDTARGEMYTPASATVRIAMIGERTHPDFVDIAERAETRDQALAGVDWDVEPQAWASCPPGSLGLALAEMIAANTYDPEIGARRERRVLPEKLARLTDHVDRLDGVWRTVAGYDAIDQHLIAFAAFTMAQTRHLFSAGALAFFGAIAHFVIPNSLPILLQIIAEGWHHGRHVPPLLGVDWRPMWAEPIPIVRSRLAVPPYKSAFSKDLFHVLPSYGAPPGVEGGQAEGVRDQRS